ncbi:MAG TPA: HIT family protein [Gammaproteobacteria bacterium]|nr:HIT family protein [Gammaproteobacteria bacterium]
MSRVITVPDVDTDGFELDARLASDCLILGKLDCSLLLLMNNSLLPWFILVPLTQETEIYQLPREQQLQLLEEINMLSDFINSEFSIEKLNVAAIGNIVKQLHVHIVGRHSSDYCWPGVVWGADQSEPYTDTEVHRIRRSLLIRLKERIKLQP